MNPVRNSTKKILHCPADKKISNGMKNQYFILRHGESLKNVKGFESCWPEKTRVPLTKKGKKQIKEAARKAKSRKINLIFASDILRARQTAEIIGMELGIKPKLDKRLREINIGIFNGQSAKESGKFWNDGDFLPPLKYYSKRFQVPSPKGENYQDVEKRLASFIKETEKKYKEKNIIIVSHQRPLTLLEKVLYGYDLKKFVKIITGNKEIKTGEMRRLKTK